MLRDIAAFEWRGHTRQIAFVIASAIFFGFGAALTATGFGPANVDVNSPFSIAQTMAFLSIPSLFILAIFCANAIVRDREHRMEEIVFSTAMTKREFLGGRFAGAFLASATVSAFAVLGMIAALVMRDAAEGRVAPFNLLHYLWPFVVFVLPNILFAATVIFAVAALTRSVLASHVAAVFIYVIYFIVAALTNSPLLAVSAPVDPAAQSMGALLDPFGLSAFFDQARYWLPAERNARLFSLSGALLANRIAAIGFAAALWVVVYRVFAFRVLARSGAPPSGDAATPGGVRREQSRRPTESSPFFSILRVDFRSLFTNIPFLVVCAMWAVLAASEITGELRDEHASRLVATTSVVLDALETPLLLIALITLIYFSGEVVWRERSARIADILHATPARSLAFVTSKWLTLSALAVTLTVIGIAVAVAVQLVNGTTPDARLLPAFLWIRALPLVLFAALAVFIHCISRYKYAGMLVVFVAAAVFARGDSFGIPHNLWRFGASPPVAWSDMNGFAPHLTAFHVYMAHWGILAALLLVVSAARWRPAPLRRASGASRGAATVLAIVAVASAGVILYNTTVLNTHVSPAEQMEWRADYEKRYKQFESLAQPRIEHLEAAVALEPSQRRAHVRGRYVLVNETSQPIARVLVSMRRDARNVRLALAGARLSEQDERFRHYWFDFTTPLAAGARADLSFDAAFEPSGFADDAPDYSILENGTYLTSSRAFPILGYRRGYELPEPGERRKQGLTPKAAEGGGPPSDHWVTFDITLSTAADQIAITSGTLVREWMANEQRHFQYRSEKPTPNALAFTSARYAVAKTKSGNTPIELYYHPAHAANVDLMLRAASQSLATFVQSFGPYRYGQLKMVEVTAYQPFGGFAMPDTIYFNESRGFLTDTRDASKLNLVYRRVAHEVAHQWWGHTVAPLNVPGGAAIAETLTKYAEVLALEKAYPREVVRQSPEYELERYLRGRVAQRDAEPPLVRVMGNEPHISYGKGTVVMMAMRDLLGERRLNEALASFAAQHGGPGRSPVAIDLVRAFDDGAPASERELIAQWWEKVVLYDLDITKASVRGTEVTLNVQASKVEVAADGRETPLPMREQIAISIDGEVSRHWLTEGDNEIRVVVRKTPAAVEVDPEFTRVDRRRANNMKRF